MFWRTSFDVPASAAQPGPGSWISPRDCLSAGDCYTCATGSQGVQTLGLIPAPMTITITFRLDVIQANPGALGANYVSATVTLTGGGGGT